MFGLFLAEASWQVRQTHRSGLFNLPFSIHHSSLTITSYPSFISYVMLSFFSCPNFLIFCEWSCWSWWLRCEDAANSEDYPEMRQLSRNVNELDGSSRQNIIIVFCPDCWLRSNHYTAASESSSVKTIRKWDEHPEMSMKWRDPLLARLAPSTVRSFICSPLTSAPQVPTEMSWWQRWWLIKTEMTPDMMNYSDKMT